MTAFVLHALLVAAYPLRSVYFTKTSLTEIISHGAFAMSFTTSGRKLTISYPLGNIIESQG